jgi:hypothetical protein
MDISVEKAKEIREQIGATHLILFAHAADGSQNVATHGGTEKEAYQAADFGNSLKKAMGWPEELCQSTPQQRAEWQRKTRPEIQADIERLQEQTRRNKAEQQTILEKFATERSSEKRMLLAHASGNLDRRNHDYWVLNGAPSEIPTERQVVYHWVDCTHVAAFKEYLAHYHDDQEEALDEYAKEHYQQWQDTAEPGDEYVISENDHSLDPYEPSFEVVSVAESEYGHTYQLAFISTGEALRFGLGWGQMRAGVIAREDLQK